MARQSIKEYIGNKNFVADIVGESIKMDETRLAYLQIRFDKIFEEQKEIYFKEAEDSEELGKMEEEFAVDKKLTEKLLTGYLHRCNTFHFMACI